MFYALESDHQVYGKPYPEKTASKTALKSIYNSNIKGKALCS